MLIENHQQLIEVILAATVVVVVIGGFIQRFASEKAIGVRFIQYTAVLTIIPVTALLAVRGLMQGETVAAIFSGTVGYLLGNISKFDDRKQRGTT